ncbi:hypothetical protein [Sporocytophaga myxococcoides]|uniref:hypothetical protein n=1 Tax=Sporocytophaga myxococcoides TaxID=153721 RepID=UPI000415ECC5|nr:hypothetical protein [Sporocytophaga myxococcoides]
MKYNILTFLLIIFCCISFAQSNEPWNAFWNKDTTLVGFKDKNGIVKIEPKFVLNMTPAHKFDDIIAATEEVNGEWTTYYLSKSGRVIGRDSLYMFDNVCDCESEGFIRFRDHKTDKVGVFNGKGDVIIPAEYNEMTGVTNGMIIALKGAEKKYWEGGEHYSWIGGKEVLIDTNNNVLIDNFKWVDNLNFYSLNISNEPSRDTLLQSFRAVDGRYYSFIDFDQEFKYLLKVNLIEQFTKDNLLNATYDEVIFWKEPKGWIKEGKKSFIERNYELIKSKLLGFNTSKGEYNIFTGDLNPYMYTSNDFDNFYNNCREPKSWIYPVKSIVITHKKKGDYLQDHFDFLRTDNGYKLICVTIERGKIK